MQDDTPMGRIAGKWPGEETDQQIWKSLQELQTAKLPDCIQRLGKTGWTFTYNVQDKVVGAVNSVGYHMSLLRIDCPDQSGINADEIGLAILRWFASAQHAVEGEK